MPFRIDQAAHDRWMQLMNNALIQSALPIHFEQTLHAFFEETSLMMINQCGPVGSRSGDDDRSCPRSEHEHR
jgi:hypothetical protein